MVVIFAHFVPFWIKKGIFTRVEPSGDAPQWPPEVLPVLRHTNHSHKILGGSKKRFFEYLGWASVPVLVKKNKLISSVIQIVAAAAAAAV